MNSKIDLDKVIIIILTILVFTPFTNIYNISIINKGYFLIYFMYCIILLIYFLLLKSIKISTTNILVYGLCLLTFISNLINENGMGSIITFITIVLQYELFKLIKWDKKNIITFNKIMLLMTLFIVLNIKNLNTNGVGQVFFFILSFSFITLTVIKKGILRYINITVLLISIYYIFNSDSRTVLVSLLIYVVLYILLNWFRVKGILLKIIYTCAIIVPLAFPYIYIFMYKNKMQIDLFTTVGKSFYSGRQFIWMECISYIKDNFWFGVGSKIDFASYKNLNVHNSFLGAILVYGAIWLIIYIILLLIFFNEVSKKIESDIVKIVFCTIISILIISCTENILTWITTATICNIFMGIGRSVYIKA